MWDKRSVDYLVQALTSSATRDTPSRANGTNGDVEKTQTDLLDTPNGLLDEENTSAYGSFIPPAPYLKEDDEVNGTAAVQTLRMDGCGLRSAVLESLGKLMSTGQIKGQADGFRQLRVFVLRISKIYPCGGIGSVHSVLLLLHL
jgi:protein phosphatase 1 regulatory subunit 37